MTWTLDDDVGVDVIVPVYRDVAVTRRCIESVLASPSVTRFCLVVVNDASPEPAMAEMLENLAAAERLVLLENAHNLGFVASVNRAMALHPSRDVVLLNSDAEVANDWLDRLHRCASRTPDVGTVTPLSNNATICSYPYEGWPGGLPGGLGLAGLDRLVAETNAGQTVTLPTAVGFCMYIRRQCLDDVGLFDAEAFGRGYGEENDFCMRATQRGWEHLLAADVYVYHAGGVSFSEERAALQAKATAVLLQRYPDYPERIQTFLARDPVVPAREAIDQARVRLGGDEALAVLEEHRGRGHPSCPPPEVALTASWVLGRLPARPILDQRMAQPDPRARPCAPFLHFDRPVLHVLPEVIGGLDRYCRDVEVAYADLARHDRLYVGSKGVMLDSHGRYFSSDLAPESLARRIGEAGYGVVHLHGVAPEIRRLAEALGEHTALPMLLTLHDFGFERPELFQPWIAPEAREILRDSARTLIRNAHALSAPSRCVVEAVRAFAEQDLGVEVLANGIQPMAQGPVPLAPEARRALDLWQLRDPGMASVLVVGAIGPGKGMARLESVGRSLREVGLQLVVIGYTQDHPSLAWHGDEYFVHGPFEPVELPTLVQAYRGVVAYFPNLAPESYCYALSDVWSAGLPAVGHGVGALAERLVAPVGEALPADADDALIVRRLLAWSQAELRHAARAALEQDLERYAPSLATALPGLDALYNRLAASPAPSLSLADCMTAVNMNSVLFRRELVAAAAQVAALEKQRDRALGDFAALAWSGEQLRHENLRLREALSHATADRGSRNLPIVPAAPGAVPDQDRGRLAVSLDILIVTYRPDMRLLADCLHRVAESIGVIPDLGLFIHDNSCDADGARALDGLLKEVGLPLGIRLCFDGSPENLGFGRAVNRLAARSQADFILLLNQDAVPDPDALEILLRQALSDSAQVAGWEMRQWPYEHPKFYDPATLETPWSSAAGWLVRRTVFEAVCGFEPRYFMYGEDVELSWRIRSRGLRLHYVARAGLYHPTYAYPGEQKPLAFYGGLFANLTLRMRYGSPSHMAQGVALLYKEWRQPESFPGRRRGLARTALKVLRHAPYFLSTRVTRRGDFEPIFAGWGFEARRQGAFYPWPELPAERLGVAAPISLILLCQGDSNGLDRLLAAVAHQVLRPREVIVVERGQPESLDVIARWRTRMPIRYLATGQSCSSARAAQIGLDAAGGDWCCLLDTAGIPFADHLATLWSGAHRAGVAGAYAPPFLLDEGRRSKVLPSGVLLFARRLYLEHGWGWDEDNGPGSVERYIALATIVCLDKSTYWQIE